MHPRLRVGGPASAAAAWTRELLAHLDTSGAPLDFLSSHVYGNGILVWNGTLDQGRMAGDARLDRKVLVRVPSGPAYTARHYRIDAEHSNIVTAWEKLRESAVWPRDSQWRTLREMNTLDELQPPVRIRAGRSAEFAFELPMPGVSYLELVP